MLQNFEKKNKEENIGRKKVKMVKNIKKVKSLSRQSQCRKRRRRKNEGEIAVMGTHKCTKSRETEKRKCISTNLENETENKVGKKKKEQIQTDERKLSFLNFPGFTCLFSELK